MYSVVKINLSLWPAPDGSRGPQYQIRCLCTWCRFAECQPVMGAVVDEANRAALGDCALDGFVIGTTASPAYSRELAALSNSANAVGFHCIVAQLYMPLSRFSANVTLVRPLTLPAHPLFPRLQWCRPALVQRYGWRRSHFYRTHLWRTVIEHGFDLLSVDLDWVRDQR